MYRGDFGFSSNFTFIIFTWRNFSCVCKVVGCCIVVIICFTIYIYIYQPFFFLIKVSGHRLVLEYELVMELNLASVSPRSPSSG